MKSVLIGSVITSEIVLEKMIETGFPINMVFSLDERYCENVSGYFPPLPGRYSKYRIGFLASLMLQ